MDDHWEAAARELAEQLRRMYDDAFNAMMQEAEDDTQ